MAEDVDVGDRFTAVSDHDRDIDQDLATVVEGHEVAAGHGLRQPRGEADTVGQESKSDAACVGDHADTIGRYGQTGRPRSMLHLPSASLLGLLELSQVQVSPAQQALRCFYTLFRDAPRERSGLGVDESAQLVSSADVTRSPAAIRRMNLRRGVSLRGSMLER